jgi:hypothetical protein
LHGCTTPFVAAKLKEAQYAECKSIKWGMIARHHGSVILNTWREKLVSTPVENRPDIYKKWQKFLTNSQHPTLRCDFLYRGGQLRPLLRVWWEFPVLNGQKVPQMPPMIAELSEKMAEWEPEMFLKYHDVILSHRPFAYSSVPDVSQWSALPFEHFMKFVEFITENSNRRDWQYWRILQSNFFVHVFRNFKLAQAKQVLDYVIDFFFQKVYPHDAETATVTIYQSFLNSIASAHPMNRKVVETRLPWLRMLEEIALRLQNKINTLWLARQQKSEASHADLPPHVNVAVTTPHMFETLIEATARFHSVYPKAIPKKPSSAYQTWKTQFFSVITHWMNHIHNLKNGPMR